MSNNHLRGSSTGGSFYKGKQIAELDEFVAHKTTATPEERKRFSEGVSAFLKGNFALAYSIFLTLFKEGNQKNPAVRNNFKLSKQKNRTE